MQQPTAGGSSDALADHQLLLKLKRRPLEGLCIVHGVDHGLAGKTKAVLVDQLYKLRKVTVRDCLERIPSAAGPRPQTAGVSKRTATAKSNATKRERLQQYFAGGGRGLKCSRCEQPLTTIRDVTATFISVSCGRYPQCKQNRKLSDVYLDFIRLLCPRLVFEAHSLRGILDATHDAFSLSVDASNGVACALVDELMCGGLEALALPPTTPDECAMVAGSGPRRGALFSFGQYHHVLAAATRLLERRQRDQDDAAGVPFKLAGLPDLPDQLRLFLHAAAVPAAFDAAAAAAPAAPDGAADPSTSAGAPPAAHVGEDVALAHAGEARLRRYGLWARLRSYQCEGVTRALRFGGTVLLGDEMGLGKTLTALATVAALDAWPCLAIVPAVTRRGWACEVERWLVGVLGPSDVHVVYDQYDALEATRPVPKLVIVSPTMADNKHQLDNLKGRAWGCAILDEAHILATAAARRDSDQTTALMSLLKAVPRRLLLTGTPATAKLFDAYNLFDVLRPGLLASNKYEYKGRFFDQASGESKLTHQLPLLTHRFLMIRRTKAQVMADLPERLDEHVHVALTTKLAKLVLATYAPTAEQRAAAAAGGGGEPPDSLQLAGIKSTAHRLGLLKALALEESDSWLHAQLSRLARLARAAAEAGAASREHRPRKLVVFAHHERVMDRLERIISKRLDDATAGAGGAGASAGAARFGCVRIDGSHTGVLKNALLERFRDDKTCLVALLSIKACGTGVDGLQHSADHAVFVELPETYALAHQAASRLHRSGQQHRVRLTWLLACAPPRRGRLGDPPDDATAAADKEAAALLRACQGADARQWAALYRNTRQIDEVFSGSVQRSASGSYTTTAPATAAPTAAAAELRSAGAGAAPASAPPLLADSALGELLFGVSPHTRYVHVFASATSSVSMAAFEPTELVDAHDDEPSQGVAPSAMTAHPPRPPPATTWREQLRRAAAAFKRAWEAQPAHGRPFAELPCTLAALPLQCAGLRDVLNDGRQHSRQRHAPRLAPSESEQASLPPGAVWIPAAVRESRTGTFDVKVHWQPFVPPASGDAGGASGGTLLCTNRACFRPLAGRAVARGRTNHPLPDPLPPCGDAGWHTEHKDVLGLVCGGPCLKAHRIARDPAAVRREVRKYHMKLSSTVFCQHCGVDVLMLVAQLRGLSSAEARQQLLLSRIPHLARWPGKMERACREPTEGHIWEADHRLEVRDGGGEASSEGAFDPLCVGCHQRKTNETTRARAGGQGGAGTASAEARGRSFSLQPDVERSSAAEEDVEPSSKAGGLGTPTVTAAASRKRKAAGGSGSLHVEEPSVGVGSPSGGPSAGATAVTPPPSATVSAGVEATAAAPDAAPDSAVSIDLTAVLDEEEASEEEDEDGDDGDGDGEQQPEQQEEEEDDDDGEDFDAVLATLPAAFFDAESYTHADAHAARTSSTATTAATAAASAARSPLAPPMPTPLPPHRDVPAAVWEVELKGSFSPYEAAVQRTLEDAFQRGEASARISACGSAYDVALRSDNRRQRGVGTEAWRSRRVRRRVS